jgi:cyclophilin family peptidyl-prolyl cis-trans isomerase
VSYTDPETASNDFSGSMVFQLFQSTTVNGKTIPLATNTISHIEEFTNDGYYTSPTSDGQSPTKLFTFIDELTSGSGSNYVVQGGEPTSLQSDTASGQPNTPFPDALFQQLAFTGTDQLAMGGIGVSVAGANDTEFFITTGNLNSRLSYGYTVFGQMVSGQAILADMAGVPTNFNGQPNNSVSITHVSLSATNPNGVVLFDTTQAKPGETALFRDTATDPTDHSSVAHDFVVTVGPYSGPTNPIINFKPFANPVAVTVPDGFSTTDALAGQPGYPGNFGPQILKYSLVSLPSHGTISDFNASTGAFEYTPRPGFAGTDSFQYLVRGTGPQGPPYSGRDYPPGTTVSSPGTVTITVTPKPRKAPPLVRLTGVNYGVNAFGYVYDVVLTFSGPLNAVLADNPLAYGLGTQGQNGSFGPSEGTSIPVTQATYKNNAVTLLADLGQNPLSQKVEVVIDGAGPHPVLDTLDRPLSSGRKGKPGGNVVAIFG